MIAEVVTSDLVMRTAPAVSPDSIIYPGRLGPGDRLYLVDGPVRGDGFDWYLAAPYAARVNLEADATSTEWVRFGWVAAADRTGEPWMVPIQPDCPDEANFETLSDLQGVLRLACFGDEPISIAGNVTCPDLGAPIPTPEPAWLTWDACYLVPLGAPPYDPLGGAQKVLAIQYPPDAERHTGPLTITGHFDDPRAAECLMFVPTQEDDIYSQDLFHGDARLGCRSKLVVDRAVSDAS